MSGPTSQPQVNGMHGYVCEYEHIGGHSRTGFVRPSTAWMQLGTSSMTLYNNSQGSISDHFNRTSFTDSIATITGRNNISPSSMVDLNASQETSTLHMHVYGAPNPTTGVRPCEQFKYTQANTPNVNQFQTYTFEPTGMCIGNPNSPTGVRFGIRYAYRVGSFTLYSIIVITGTTTNPWLPATADEVMQRLIQVGLIFYGYYPTNFRHTPMMRCINTQTDQATTVTVEPIFATTPIRLEVLDGDPPFLAQISTTEPEARSIGDLWYNPQTNSLSIFTGR